MKHFLYPLYLAVLLLPGTVHAYVEPEDVLFGKDDVIIDDGLHGAASSAPSSKASSSVSSVATEPDGTFLTPREERILQRIENRQDTPTYQAPSDGTLHSGAPAMSHTGPETMIALTLLAIAMVATVLFARSGRIDFTQK